MAAVVEKMLTVGQFARRKGVAVSTVRAWIEDGFIQGVEWTAGLHARIPISELARTSQATRAKRRKRYALDEN